jgi:hypothetical protein
MHPRPLLCDYITVHNISAENWLCVLWQLCKVSSVMINVCYVSALQSSQFEAVEGAWHIVCCYGFVMCQNQASACHTGLCHSPSCCYIMILHLGTIMASKQGQFLLPGLWGGMPLGKLGFGPAVLCMTAQIFHNADCCVTSPNALAFFVWSSVSCKVTPIRVASKPC